MVKDALRIAELEKLLAERTAELIQQSEQLSVVNSVQEALVNEMDLQAIYELVGEKIRELFDAQALIISTFDHDTETEHFEYTIENGERFYPDSRPINKLRKSLIAGKSKIIINTKAEAEEWFGKEVVPGTKYMKSGVFVPLVSAGIVTSYVSLQNVEKENAFSDSEIRLLETLANSMAAALQNARLLKETEQRTAELAVINSVQEGLARELDIQAIYDLVGNRIRELFNAQVVILATFDHKRAMEVIHFLIEKGDRYYPIPRPYNILRRQLLEKKQKILINRNLAEVMGAFGEKQIPGTEMPKSMLFVPLMIGDKVTGYASIQNIDIENAFSDADVRLLETLANTMGVALENARLFDETNRLLKETEQQKAELGVINSVQEGLARELDMQAIYDLVGDRITKLFKAQAVVIATFDHETATEHFKYLMEDGQRFYLASRPYDKLRQHLIISRQKIVINTNYAEAYAKFGLRTLPGTNTTMSGVFVPLVIGERVNSYISLQNNEMENAFSDGDVRLLETLANSMSVALENARLFDETNRLLKETEQRTAELALINSVQEGLARELDINSIYDLVGNKIREVFDAQAVIIATFDHELGTENFNYLFENGERFFAEPRRYDKLRYELIMKKQKILINENAERAFADYGLKVVAGSNVPKSMLFVPLVLGNRVTSYVSLQNTDKEHAFSEADVRLLETLANSMSISLGSARLFDETNRLLKETEQRNAELAVINKVQESLVARMDIMGIYELVGEKLREIFEAQVIDIVTYNKSTETIEDKYAYESGDRSLLGPRPVNGFRKMVVETGKILLLNQDILQKSIEFDNPAIIGEVSKSAIFIPMLAGGEVKGIISLQNLDHENAFSEADVNLITTLANSMSVALESARLFDETNRLLKETDQRNAELAVINSVQESLVAKMDMQGIYDLVGEKIRELFDAQVVDIVTYDSVSQLIEDRYAFEKGDRTLLGKRPVNGFRKHVVQTKQVLVHNDNVDKAMVEFGNEVLIGDVPKSQVYVPMIAGGEVKGIISLQNLDHEHAFSEADVNLITTLANSMSVALESARLFDETTRLLNETEQRTAELSVINSVQEGLAKELDTNGIYELVGERLCNLFPETQTLVIRTFDHEKGLENWQYAMEKGVRQIVAPRPFNWNSRILIESRKPLDIRKDYVEESKRHGGTGVTAGQPPKSAVFVPMVVGDVVKGSVSLQNVDRENAFNESDLRLLTTITNSMSVALENARLFNETALLLDDSKQRAAELGTVNNISKALASLLDPGNLIKMVGDQLKDLFNANIVYLAIHNPETNIISFPYQYGDTMDPLKLGEGLTSRIITTGEPLLINKDMNEQRAQMGVKKVGIDAASYLGVPIPVGDEIIGVLSVQSTEKENRFNENDLRLLTTIAASVGVALRNATLFEDVKKAKLEAEEAGKAAELANEAKSAFLSTVSHELRTPLTSVLGFAKIIRKRLDEKVFPAVSRDDPKIEKSIGQITENLQVVISEGERLTHLINDVLDLAKIEAGKMEWSREPVFMPEVAERAIAATTSLFHQKSLTLVKQIETDLPEITGDRDKLIQVIINLISNAVKFTEEGTVICQVHKGVGEIIVSVSDTGIGIATEDFGTVFEQFKQVGGDTLTDKPKGTGLGLPICKEIVEHHGGRIWLESEPGRGSKFSFALPVSVEGKVERPLHLDDLVKELKAQVANSKIGVTDGASHILIVDDDESIRALLRQELGDAGYSIHEARNGKEALQLVRTYRPDLIILDIMMPEMNGFDVAAVLKNDPQTMDIPIIVLSVVQDKARGFRIGVDRYLTKPIDTGLLFNEVGSLLEQGKSKKKVMIVDSDSDTLKTLTEVLQSQGYEVTGTVERELVEKAIANQPDIIMMNAALSAREDIVQSLRFEKGLEKVLFVMYH